MSPPSDFTLVVNDTQLVLKKLILYVNTQMSDRPLKTNQQLKNELATLENEMARIEAETAKVRRELKDLDRQAARPKKQFLVSNGPVLRSGRFM